MRYIALLRGINVGGNKKVPMAGLRAMLAELGFDDVATILQSGNAVFSASRRTPATLEKLLEEETAARIGVECDYHVRTASEWEKIIASNPFEREARDDPSRMLVMCFREPLDATRVAALKQSPAIDRERVEASGRELYLSYPGGIGTTKLSNVVIERALGAKGTARNWNTALKLAALAR